MREPCIPCLSGCVTKSRGHAERSSVAGAGGGRNGVEASRAISVDARTSDTIFTFRLHELAGCAQGAGAPSPEFTHQNYSVADSVGERPLRGAKRLTSNTKRQTLQHSETQYRMADRLVFDVKRSMLGVEPAAGASRHTPMPPTLADHFDA